MLHNISELFTWHYYKDGLTGWTTQSKIWWLVGVIILTLTGLVGNINTLTALSWLGGVIGFTCTLAITNHKRINGLLGFVSAVLISVVAFHSGNFSDIAMQIGYILALDIPVIVQGDSWQKVNPHGMDKRGLGIILVTLIVGYGLLFFLDTQLGSPRPEIDAFAAVIGFIGAFLMLGNYKVQYIAWALQGILSVILWAITATQMDTVNWVPMMIYVLYLGNDVLGLFFSEWRMFNIKK